MKECPPRRLAELAAPFLQGAGQFGAHPGPEVLAWIERVLDAVLKNVSLLSQLPEAARIIFEFDAQRALATPEFQELLANPAALEVLKAFIPKGPGREHADLRALSRNHQGRAERDRKEGEGFVSSHSHGGDRRRFRTGTGKADSHLRGRREIALGAACEKRGRAAEGIFRGGETVKGDCSADLKSLSCAVRRIRIFARGRSAVLKVSAPKFLDLYEQAV